VEEDSLFDSEYAHTTETAAYLAIQGNGELTAFGGMSSPASTTYYETQGGALAIRRAGYPADNGIFYILSDHLGSSSVLLAQDGTVLKRDYYYPYGGNRGAPYTDVTTRRFTGQYHEAGLPGGEGLSFYNARWYDPQLGRFVSADSLVPNPSRPQGFNRYSYVLNSPLKYRDPSGHINCALLGDAGDIQGCNDAKLAPPIPRVTKQPSPCNDVWCIPRGYVWIRLPVENPTFIQWYGNTQWAYINGAAHNYPDFAQGLHPGIDFGGVIGIPVYAGMHGTVECINTPGPCGAYEPGRINIRGGGITALYGHIDNIQVEVGDLITPDTIVGYIGPPEHMHLEITLSDINGVYMTNPLPYFSPEMQQGLQEIAVIQSLSTDQNLLGMVTFYVPPSGNLQWQDPYNQPDLRREAGNLFPK